MYKEANGNLDVAPVKSESAAEVKETVSDTEKVPSEDTENKNDVPSVDSTETDNNNVDNEPDPAPVRRRRRRTE